MHFNVDTSSTNVTLIVRYFKRQYISLLLRLLSFLIQLDAVFNFRIKLENRRVEPIIRLKIQTIKKKLQDATHRMTVSYNNGDYLFI